MTKIGVKLLFQEFPLSQEAPQARQSVAPEKAILGLKG